MRRPARRPILAESLYIVHPARPERRAPTASGVRVPPDQAAVSLAPPPTAKAAPRREVARGLRYVHFRANANSSELIQIASTVSAATELLAEQGLLDGQALEQRKTAHSERISKDFAGRGLGVTWDHSTADKYAFDGAVKIDCENRLSLCQASCCRLSFALTRQDVEEGLLEWEFANPYHIAQGPDGYCAHLDRGARNCAVHASRPLTCRSYDCRHDQRIWLDFENRVVNPKIYEPAWPRTGTGVKHPPEPESAVAEPPSREEMPRRGVAAAVSRLMERAASSPVLYRGHGHIVSSYGVFLSAGFALGLFYWLLVAGYRFHQAPSPLFVVALAVAAFGGSRLLHAGEREAASWFRHPNPPQRGHAFYGGILGAIALALWWFSGRPADLMLLADCAAPAVALGYAVAKLGCLTYGCCVGAPTRFALRIRYTAPAAKAVTFHELKGVPLIPVQLYETLLGLAVFVVLSAVPLSWFGGGRVAGIFLGLLTLGRTVLMQFRYRALHDYAAALFTGAAHLLFAAAAVLLLSGAATRGPVSAGEPSLVWLLALPPATAFLVLYLFGVYPDENDPEIAVKEIK